MQLMKSMAQELAPQKIRVNSIAPGAIKTPINRAAWETREALNSLLTLIPDGRIGEPDDIARTAVWLASDLSDYVTGATIFVDGGMTLYPGFMQLAGAQGSGSPDALAGVLWWSGGAIIKKTRPRKPRCRGQRPRLQQSG